ncbi:MAG TPA: 3'-5' exonuclease [Gemmatimonadaceae bacterium]|nr:3'-5' exonuclease [Gemmatimonadaceae bacterium]
MELTRGVYTEPEDTLLTTRALNYLSSGPADVVDLIGYICALPGAPRIVAEHMAHAMFAGRPQFARTTDGKWMLTPSVPVQKDVRGRRAGRGTREAGSGDAERSSETAAYALGGSDRLQSLSYVVVDTETTGGSMWFGDRITEVAAVVVRNGEIANIYETLVNPERAIPPFITALTNITWDMVRDAPTFDRVAPDLLRVLEGNVFVAHNANFDWRFLTNEISRATGHQLRGRKLCTVKIARKVLPQLSRRSLDHIARYYGVEIRNRHRAGGDAIATAKCLVRMLNDLSDRGCETWGDLQELLRRGGGRKKRKRRPPAMPTSVTRDTTA